MSATVAAALKKIAVAVLTDKKLRRTVLGIILGVIIIIIMPVAAVISLFNGDIEIDTDRLQTLVVENLSAEEKAKLQAVEDMMKAIEVAMTEKGFTAEKVKEAQVLYVLALSDYAEQTDFVSKLAGCFTEDQTDEQLIIAVNTAFGTTLNAEDFTKFQKRNFSATASRKCLMMESHIDTESFWNSLGSKFREQGSMKKSSRTFSSSMSTASSRNPIRTMNEYSSVSIRKNLRKNSWRSKRITNWIGSTPCWTVAVP